MSDFWNERYRQKEFAYGEGPNLFFKQEIEKLQPGKILFPAEGEGRNAVYAAKKGWTVSAFDISIEGKNKALELAKKNNVSIEYEVGQLPDLNYRVEQFDVIALVYAHFSADTKSKYHKLLDKYLKPGGLIIFEAFGKKQIEYQAKNKKAGGPKNLDVLFSIDELKSDFANYRFIELTEKEVELSEGLYHNGKSSVIRFVAQKKYA